MHRFKMFGILALLAVLTLTVSLAGEYPEQGDVILTAGYAVTAPRDATDQRTSGLVAGLEGFVSDHFSLGLAVSQADTEEAEKAYSAFLAPRWGNVYFPVGLYGVDIPGRNTPAWGASGGIGCDFWNSSHFGIGLKAEYLMLQNTAVQQDFYQATGSIRLRF